MLRIRDVYPGSRVLIFIPPGYSRIQRQQQKRREKICCPTFYYCHKFHKIVNYLSFEITIAEKIRANWQRILVLFTQKIVTNSQKYGLWEGPGSGKNLSQIQGFKKHWIPDLQQCLKHHLMFMFCPAWSTILCWCVVPLGLSPGAHAAYITAHDTACPDKGKIFEVPITVVRTEELSQGLKPSVTHQARGRRTPLHK